MKDTKFKLIRSDDEFARQLSELAEKYNMSEAAVIRLSVKKEFEKNIKKTKGDN